MSDRERFLVTGAGGCIGAWAVKVLVDEGTAVVALDVLDDLPRLRLTLDREGLDRVVFRQGDVRDLDGLVDLVRDERITRIVHLAALQVPFCKADPPLGAQVNVTGTVNVFEAKRHSEGRVAGLSWASSIAVFGPAEMYPEGTARDDSPASPATLYGAYKQANEWTARIYAADWDVGSVGLRPSVVYGPGRDQGLTSDPTRAMLAAVSGSTAHVAFGGKVGFQHAEDVARCFVAAARMETSEALIHNIGCRTAEVADFIALIEQFVPEARGRITIDDIALPLPADIDGSGLESLIGDAAAQRPLDEGVARSIEAFRRLLAEGLVAPVA